jgi:GNAT superfamily N-acetyltransferase
VCDVLTPWAHGTITRATRYPDYWEFNLVRVEERPSMGVAELVDVADQALAGLRHRRIDFDLIDAAEPLRAGFEAQGWKATRLLWMHYEADPPPAPEIAVEEVPYDAVHQLRVAWHEEDFPNVDASGFHANARELALRHGARVLAVVRNGQPVGFAQLEGVGTDVEIREVFVHARHRGGGVGTALTRAAIKAASGARDLWICADEEERPKHLYARLGFRTAWTTMELLLPPPAAPSER